MTDKSVGGHRIRPPRQQKYPLPLMADSKDHPIMYPGGRCLCLIRCSADERRSRPGFDRDDVRGPRFGGGVPCRCAL